VSDDFLATWHVLQIFTDALVLAYYPDRADAARRDITQLLAQL
jgi:hypothetical protein